MSFHPVLVLLLFVLLGLLALSMGYRRRPNKVAPLRRVVTRLQRLAADDPARYGPSLAVNLRLYAVELMESGRPMQALVVIMTSVDLLRALSTSQPGRFDGELSDALTVEDELKVAIGFDPAEDLHALAAEEDAAQDAYARAGARRAFFWQIALMMWLLSVSVFVFAAV